MEFYNQLQLQNEQMMLYHTLQMQQQAYLYSNYNLKAYSYMQQQSPVNMEDNSDKKKNKRSYIQCELWKRQTLIEKVEKDGMTIKDAAKYLEINYSTAKHIMKVFRQTGEVETKIMMKKKNRDSKQCNYIDQDVDMDVERQYSANVDSEPQAYYCESNCGQWQLPMDENIMNANFQPESMSDEERQSHHAFLFWSQSLYE